MMRKLRSSRESRLCRKTPIRTGSEKLLQAPCPICVLCSGTCCVIPESDAPIYRPRWALFWAHPYTRLGIRYSVVCIVIAVEKAAELKPDLITLDLSMPRMNGLEAARILKSKMKHVPVILFTNYADALRGLRCG